MKTPKRDKLSYEYSQLHALECIQKDLEVKLQRVKKGIHKKKVFISRLSNEVYNA